MMTQLCYCTKCAKHTRQVLSKDYKSATCICDTENQVTLTAKHADRKEDDKPSEDDKQ